MPSSAYTPPAATVPVPTALIRDRHVPDQAARLYAHIASAAQGSTDGMCHTQQAEMACEIGWSLGQVERGITALVARGWLAALPSGRDEHYQPVHTPPARTQRR